MSISSHTSLPPSGGTNAPDEDPLEPIYRPRTDVTPLKLETRGVTQRNLQKELWARQTIHKNAMAAKLREFGEHFIAASLEKCHSEYTFAICTSCGDTQKFPNRCDRFFCPECQPRLSSEREKTVAWWTKEITQPKHVVLTVVNIEHLTKGHVKEFKKWFLKLRRSKFCDNWHGGFYNIEVTNEGKGWHLHIHCLIDAGWIDQFALSEAWHKATNGFGKIVKVQDARRVDYLKEVTKYAVKGNMLAAWTGEQIATFIHAFEGVRCFGVFGSLYKKRTEFAAWIALLGEHGNICKCGCSEFSYYSECDFLLRDFVATPQLSEIPPPISDLQIDLI